MNLFLHGVEDFQIVRGDTLRDPAFFDGDRLATFDCVIANPPFSLEKWGEDLWAADRFGRNFAGVPPTKQRRLRLGAAHGQVDGRQERPDGRRAAAGCAVPQRRARAGSARSCSSSTWSKRSSGSRRTSSTAPASPRASWSLATASPTSARRRCSFVDASTLFKRGRNQNTLEPEHAEQILGWLPGVRRCRRPRARRRPSTRSRRTAGTSTSRATSSRSPATTIPTLAEALAELERALRRASSRPRTACAELLPRARLARVSEPA